MYILVISEHYQVIPLTKNMNGLAKIMEHYKDEGQLSNEDMETPHSPNPKKRNRVEGNSESPQEDSLDLRLRSIWDNRVIIPPSQPVDIPPRKTPVTPTTGVPKSSMLHKILTQDWYHEVENTEKKEIDTPSVAGPSKVVFYDTEYKEEECLDPPSSFAPLRQVMLGEKPMKMKSNWPNIIYRLSYVLGMLARPDIVLDSLTHPLTPQLENSWYFPLKQIHEKRKLNKPVTVAEAALYSGTKGFLYIPILRAFNRSIVSRRYRSNILETELIINQPWMSSHPNYCTYCQVIHSSVGTSHPNSCYFVYANGPRAIEDLVEDKSWLQTAKAVLLSHQNLYFMPASSKHKIINLACPHIGDYMVPATAQEINNTPIIHDKSLISRINRAIQLVGQQSKLPILIEFYENSKYPTANVALHLAGFAQAVRCCQPNYFGPIIVIIPPIRAVSGETEESYAMKKSRLAQVQNYGHLIGLAMGVPTIHIQAQITQYTEAGESINYGSWIPEPLFGSKGTHTREYMSRLYVWFEALSKVLNGEIAIGMRPANT